MKTSALWLLFFSALFFNSGFAQNSTQVSDAFIEGKLISVYTLNEQLNPFDIDIESKDGVVTLKGAVENDIDRDLALELAQTIEGVKQVDNQLTIDPTIARSDEPSGFASSVRNATITAKIKSQLLWNSKTDGLDIQVNTRNGSVTLEGVVASEEESGTAEEIARNTTGVRMVDNRLKVDPAKSTDIVKDTTDVVKETAKETATAVKEVAKETAAAAKETAEDLGRATKDTWISTKVKTLLVFDRRFGDTDVGVETSEGIVTLSGTVNSDMQEQQLVQAVRDVKGVASVNAEQLQIVQ
jgi:osmotically-inducible protein OsmY